jgi:peptide-methionine (S)-S-oxide reductase
MAKATFAAGCFWGVESVFDQINGVTATRVGYTGGHTDDPTYRDVCSHRTGHAEAVEVEYDPDRVSYERLLDVFWSNHDPTQLNRQGPDVGDQYRSAIFVHDEKQQQTAERSIERLASSARFRKPIVTQVVPAMKFWGAEEYHQKYFAKRGIAATCHL